MKKAISLLMILLVLLPGCGHTRNEIADLSGYANSDMTGYAGLAGYEKPLQFVDMTVADIAALKNEGKTFAFVASFATCPWCNAVMRYINDAALEADLKIGNLDTRKDPSWESNLDITDYDLFADLFADELELDEEDRLHLYVPHVFYVKEGEVVYDHQGALPEMGDDPSFSLTPEQKESLTEIYRAGFRKMGTLVD